MIFLKVLHGEESPHSEFMGPLLWQGSFAESQLLSNPPNPPNLLRCKTDHQFHPMSNDFHITGFSCKIISKCSQNGNLRGDETVVWIIFFSLVQTPLDRFPIALLPKKWSETTGKLSVMQQIANRFWGGIKLCFDKKNFFLSKYELFFNRHYKIINFERYT